MAAPGTSAQGDAAPASGAEPVEAGSATTSAGSGSVDGASTPAPAGDAVAAPAEPTGTVDAGASGSDGMSWVSEIPWPTVLIVVLVIALVVVAIVLIVRWQRKRSAAAAPSAQGPSVASTIGSVWRPFYARIPRRAHHYPTFVVLGEAGVGKSHLITSRVDWRGQANQFNHSAYHGAALQLYLGPDVVVHELSATLLRDVSRSAKRALTRLWTHMGPSATVVLALDARTLTTTAPADFRALAQLVRGKISLFPARCRQSLDIRVALTHLDQVEGYEEFASVVGTHSAGMDGRRLGPDYTDADALVAAYDAHLAYALTTRDGAEFSRLVGFYDALAALVRTLPPLLTALRGEDRFDAQYPTGDLYLGSIVPHSYVGDPFTADEDLVSESIERYNQRHLRGALIMGVASLVGVGILTGWHYSRILDAEEAVDHLKSREDDELGDSIEERDAAKEATEAIDRMFGSELLWLRWLSIQRKQDVELRFARTIQRYHLDPWLAATNDRIVLHYVVSLIYASRDDELGALIMDNALTWAEQLKLSNDIVYYYIQARRQRSQEEITLPDEIEATGEEWTNYLRHLCDAFEQETIPEAEVEALRTIPKVLSAAQYETLERTRELLSADPLLGPQLYLLLADELDSQWAVDNHEHLRSLTATLKLLLSLPTAEERELMVRGWGLGDLQDELERIELLRQGQQPGRVYELTGSPCSFDTGKAADVMARTQAKLLIEDALESLPYERRGNGMAFFNERETLADVGIISGYGGRATETLSGFYTKSAFDDHVAPVLAYASEELPLREIAPSDRIRVERAVKEVAARYASAYRDALVTYYQSFEFRPGSEVALPFALKPLTQPSSWFTDFLTTVSQNATMNLPENEFYDPMTRALEVFGPLNALLVEDKGAIPGLDPYAAIIAGLIPLLEGSGDTAGGGEAAPEDGLRPRLSPLGLLTLDTLTGAEVDRREQVSQWLQGASVDYSWHDPFDSAVNLVYRYGSQNIEDEVEQAWEYEVRPVVLPLLLKYPFDGAADEDAAIGDIEAIMRQQGKEPGLFWERFDQLIAPATRRRGDRYVMYPEVYAPLGMLDLVHDVQDLSALLWDGDGARVPLMLEITPQALPGKAYDGRVASMAYLRSGGSAVYAFNQRPEAQTLALRWWEQETSVVSLKMTVIGSDKSREYTIEQGGTPFSFYRLLDEANRCKGTRCEEREPEEPALTRWAVSRGKGCGRWAARGTTDLPVGWTLTLDSMGTHTAQVRFVLDSDPWAPFVVRDCR